MKFYNYVGVGFGTGIHTHSVGVNAYFDQRIKIQPLTTPNCGQYSKNIIWTITGKLLLSRKLGNNNTRTRSFSNGGCKCYKKI